MDICAFLHQPQWVVEQMTAAEWAEWVAYRNILRRENPP